MRKRAILIAECNLLDLITGYLSILIRITPIRDAIPNKRKNIGDPYPKLREKALSANKIRATEAHLWARI